MFSSLKISSQRPPTAAAVVYIARSHLDSSTFYSTSHLLLTMFSFTIFLIICLASVAPLPITTTTHLCVPSIPTTTASPVSGLDLPVAAPTVRMSANLSPALFPASNVQGPMGGVQLRDNFNICLDALPFTTFTVYCSLPAASSATFKVYVAVVRREYSAPFFVARNSKGVRYPWRTPRGPLTSNAPVIMMRLLQFAGSSTARDRITFRRIR